MKRLDAQVLRSAEDVCGPPDAVLEAAGIADHRGVEAGTRHDREPLAGEAAEVELVARAVEADVDCALDVLEDAKVRRDEISLAGRDDRKARPGAGGLVDAALHHPVAAPGKNEIGALVEDAANALRRLATLGTSCQVNDGGLEPYLTLVDATARKHGSEQPSGCHDGLLRLQRVPGCGGRMFGMLGGISSSASAAAFASSAAHQSAIDSSSSSPIASRSGVSTGRGTSWMSRRARCVRS